MIDFLFDTIFDILEKELLSEKRVGKYGESLTARELKLLDLLGNKGKILRNLYIPKDDGTTSEIDLIFITQKGIFVIESKNYSGWIFGKQYDQYWTQSLPNRSKKRFYNPIRQNYNHIVWLKKHLNLEIPMFSFIVFSERCEIKNVAITDGSVFVMKRDKLNASIKQVWKDEPDILDSAEIEQIYNNLLPLTQADSFQKAAHIAAIHQKLSQNKNENCPERNVVEHAAEVNRCPKCGANLVLRTAKTGQYAGNQFYGCSNFPKCRFIKNTETQDDPTPKKE